MRRVAVHCAGGWALRSACLQRDWGRLGVWLLLLLLHPYAPACEEAGMHRHAGDEAREIQTEKCSMPAHPLIQTSATTARTNASAHCPTSRGDRDPPPHPSTPRPQQQRTRARQAAWPANTRQADDKACQTQFGGNGDIKLVFPEVCGPRGRCCCCCGARAVRPARPMGRACMHAQVHAVCICKDALPWPAVIGGGGRRRSQMAQAGSAAMPRLGQPIQLPGALPPLIAAGAGETLSFLLALARLQGSSPERIIFVLKSTQVGRGVGWGWSMRELVYLQVGEGEGVLAWCISVHTQHSAWTWHGTRPGPLHMGLHV